MEGFIRRLKEIYDELDTDYREVQNHYRFNCKGCEDNCCKTKFHHHTIAEALYLAEGLKKLSPEKRSNIIARAEQVASLHGSSPEDMGVLCPLNEDGLCVLYEYRPMLCRIHGVPYVVYRMDGTSESGIGCLRFISEKEKDEKTERMNRTRYYTALAMLEKELRGRLDFKERYKKTTAEMILSLKEQL